MRPASKQRLGRHVPAATVTHAAGEKGCCLGGPPRGVIKKRTRATNSVDIWQSFSTGLEHGGRGIAIVNIRYQETSSENNAEE
jgi:hypothetical protein